MKLSVPFICCLFFGSFGQLCGYITNIITWEKDGQIVIGCGDIHDPRPFRTNVSQRKFLSDRLALLDPATTRILVEDVKAYEGSDHLIAEYVERWPTMMPQNEFIALARDRNPKLKTTNLEYRHARSAALTPFIERYEDTPIKAQTVIEEFDTKVALIKSYGDGEQLTKYYQEQIAAINDKNSHVLEQIRRFPDTLTEWIRSQLPLEKQILFAQRLSCWDAHLLDLMATHELVQYPKIQKFIIFAGALHIDHIGRALVSLRGFNKTSSLGVDCEMPYGNTSLDLAALRPNAPPEQLLSRFTPLPAEELKVLFE